MRTPRISNPARPANQYALPGERIIEFSDEVAGAGGLISFQRMLGNDGRATLRVCLYRMDAENVEIIIASDFPKSNVHHDAK